MVKRPKSPELAEDARFFTVYQPYPINANWILEEEQKKCSMWVAECIGLNYLWAIHYKPKARGMILLEVSKDFKDHGRLLGEHRWADILKNPDELEKKSVTQVFHCFYSRLRDCQKDGWKAIPIQNSWFKGWTPGQGDIRRPYPPTHWCPVPAEDRTNKTLCRPLPSEAKPPPPPRSQQQVVGSSKWVVDKQLDAPLTPSAVSNAWAKKTPPLDARGTKSPSPSVASQHSAGPSTASASGSKLPPAKNSRAKPVPLNAFISGETSTGNNAWGKPPAVNKFAINDPDSKGSVNAWSKKLNIPPSEKSPRAPTSPSPYEKDYSAWATPSNPTPHSPPQSLASRLSSRIPEDPPPPRSRRGKGKERDYGKQPAWKSNGQWAEEKPSKEPVYSLANIANRKPPTRADIDATLRPWERGKVDYAKLGVVDEPEPPTNLDWKMDPPTNDWNKPLDEEKTSNTEWKMDPPTNDWNKPLDEARSSNLNRKTDPPANDRNKPRDKASSSNLNWKMDPPANDWNKPLNEARSSNLNRKMDPPANDRNKPRDKASSSNLNWKMDPPANDWNKPLDEARSSNINRKMDPPANDRNKPRDKASSSNLNWKMDPPANDWNKPLDEASSNNLNWKMDPPANDWNKPLDETSSTNLNWKMDPPANDWNKPLDETSSTNLDWKMDPPANDWNKPLDEASSTNLDWKMDPPADDWNKPYVEGSSNNDTSSSAPSYDKKRKPDGQFNKDGEPQYDRYGEPSNRYDSRKRATYGYSEYSSRTYGGGGSSYPDRGRGRGRGFGRGGYRGNPNAWDARRDASGPRYKEVGVKWYSGRKNGDSDATTQAANEGKPDWGNTDDNHTKDTFKYPSYYEKPIGTSWGDTPVTGTEEPAAEFKYPEYYENPIGTSWGDLPITSTDESESKDWATGGDGGDGGVEGEGQEGEWNNGEGEEADANEEPPNSDQGEEGYEEGGEYGEYDENDYQPEATEDASEPTTSATDWGSGPAEVRGPNDWGLAPGEKKVNSWGFPEPEDNSAEDNPWAKKPATDASAWFADGIIPAHIQDWDKVIEEGQQPNQPQVEELICPTHNIACYKGICRDMAALIRERDMAQWMRTRGRGRGRPNGGRGWGDPRGPRGSWGAKELPDDEVVTYKRTRRGNKKNKPKPTIGVMRGFEEGTTAPADGTAASEVGPGGHDGNETGSDG